MGYQHMTFQDPIMHGSKDVGGIKYVTEGRIDKPKALRSLNCFFKMGGGGGITKTTKKKDNTNNSVKKRGTPPKSNNQSIEKLERDAL